MELIWWELIRVGIDQMGIDRVEIVRGLELSVSRSPHTTVESLKVSLVKVWVKITQKNLRTAVESFRGRIDRVIAAEGWHIEN